MRLVYIIKRPVKIFALKRVSMMIVFAIHNAEIFSIVLSGPFNAQSFGGGRINWFTHFPIIFSLLLESGILFFAVRWCFVDIPKIVGMLPLSTRLVKILFIMEV